MLLLARLLQLLLFRRTLLLLSFVENVVDLLQRGARLLRLQPLLHLKLLRAAQLDRQKILSTHRGKGR